MTNYIMLYTGSMILIGWGIFHIVPTSRLIKFFGSISEDKKRIITMEWIAEGLTLCFIGTLVLFVTHLTDSPSRLSNVVFRASALMLVVMAVVDFQNKLTKNC